MRPPLRIRLVYLHNFIVMNDPGVNARPIRRRVESMLAHRHRRIKRRNLWRRPRLRSRSNTCSNTLIIRLISTEYDLAIHRRKQRFVIHGLQIHIVENGVWLPIWPRATSGTKRLSEEGLQAVHLEAEESASEYTPHGPVKHAVYHATLDSPHSLGRYVMGQHIRLHFGLPVEAVCGAGLAFYEQLVALAGADDDGFRGERVRMYSVDADDGKGVVFDVELAACEGGKADETDEVSLPRFEFEIGSVAGIVEEEGVGGLDVAIFVVGAEVALDEFGLLGVEPVWWSDEGWGMGEETYQSDILRCICLSTFRPCSHSGSWTIILPLRPSGYCPLSCPWYHVIPGGSAVKLYV